MAKFKHVIVVETDEELAEFDDSIGPYLATMLYAQVRGDMEIRAEINQLPSKSNPLKMPAMTAEGE